MGFSVDYKLTPEFNSMVLWRSFSDTCGHPRNCRACKRVCDWLSEGHGWAEKQTAISIRLIKVSSGEAPHTRHRLLLLLLLLYFVSLPPIGGVVLCLRHWAPVEKRRPHLWDLLQVCHMVEAGLICIPCRRRQNSAAAWLWSTRVLMNTQVETKEEARWKHCSAIKKGEKMQVFYCLL